MNRSFKILSALFVSILAFSSCEESEVDEELKKQEQRYFDLYIDANYADLQPSETGLYYIPVKEGDGASPDSGDFVLINYVAFAIPEEIVADTYDEQWAIDNNLFIDGVMYGPYKYECGTEIDGLDEGVFRMKEGGISRMVFSSDLGYGATGLGNRISPFQSLMYDVELIEVIGNPVTYSQQQIAAYLDTIGNATAYYDSETEATYYYIEDEAGTGDLLAEEDEVTIYYEGSLLDGRIFDANFESEGGLDVIIGTTSLIRGWTIGLTHFRRGGKGRLLLPYELAYGESGETASGTNKYSIPPYEALLFEIEVAEEEEEE